MALYNTKDKWLFIHIYKTGGMALRKCLTTKLEGNKEILGGHCECHDLKIHFQSNEKDKYDDLFKFSIVRNPFDWMVSLFHYIRTFKTHFLYDIVKDMNFNQFILWYQNNHKNYGHGKRPFGSNKILTLTEFLYEDKKLLVDFILRKESLNDDYDRLRKKIDLPKMTVPRFNTLESKRESYRQYYSAHSIKVVEHIFEEDLINFNYNF